MQTLSPAPHRDALFLDFDGTLTELAARPEAVRVAAGLPQRLQQLSDAFGGALAIVSGRPIETLDAFLRPLKAAAAGVHGAERRRADGTWQRLQIEGLDALAAVARELAAGDARLLVEVKSASVALHYRQAPEREADCVRTMGRAVANAPDWVLLQGKMVVEVKPRSVSKGSALRAFLAEPPFAGRRPWCFGDDVTDEAAFEVAQALGGVAVKVGPGPSCAQERLDDPAALRGWLAELASELERGGAANSRTG